MLKISVAEENCIHKSGDYFNIIYDPKWITSEFGKAVINDVEKAEVISERILHSELFGTFSPYELSTGTKTLLLLNFTDGEIFNASRLGDNCIKWMIDISKRKDIRLSLFYMLDIYDLFPDTVYFEQLDKYTNSPNEYFDIVSEILDREGF